MISMALARCGISSSPIITSMELLLTSKLASAPDTRTTPRPFRPILTPVFAASVESSAHENFKQRIINSSEGDTQLTMKQLTPVRLIKNKFFHEVIAAEQRGASNEEMLKLLGRARAKRGMFEGDLDEGELEIGC